MSTLCCEPGKPSNTCSCPPWTGWLHWRAFWIRPVFFNGRSGSFLLKKIGSPLTFLTQHTLGKESSISFLIIYFGQLGLCWTLVLMTISVIWFGKWRTTNHLRCLSWSKQQNPSPRALQGWNYFFCLFPMTESELVPVKLMSFITTLLYCPSIKDVQPW